MSIRNSCKLWLTTSVAIALCTARELSRDLDVARRVYI